MTVAELIKPPVWHGTPGAYARLAEAVRANCAERERLDAEGRDERCYACPACLVLMDQAELDHLAFAPDTGALKASEQTEPPNILRWHVPPRKDAV